MRIKKNFKICEDRYFDHSDEELNIFCNYFRNEQNALVTKTFIYDKEAKNNLNAILNEEI